MKIPRFSEVMQWILGTFGIIESAGTIPFRNPNFIILKLITSLPLFFLTLIHQLPYDFQPSLIVHAINLRTSLSYHSNPLISDMLLYPIGCPTRFFRLFRKIHWIVYGLAFAIWLDYSARWNLSVVVSILEEKVGVFEAISASSELTKGNRLRGFFLMLLFSVAKFNLPTLVAREFTTIFAFYFLYTIFMCLGNVITWVVLTVYYYDCKNRHQKAAAVTSFDTGNTLR
ncbi:hypothetical protein D8674_016356 [Pyrus ussuriensis x Pyrus communis]|uniref:Uncharacterized protein n=1 Tax=Pyrus ussuriensis x Pyrus communis TaxID=2448454 RepID=A0A5N5H9K7_9ROSA|nr:hypothetical protein D8674_016356 [Pyrus ussuriensis x Pyrus communis]